MQFTNAVAVLAVAATASAYSNDTVVYTTLVVDSYTTVCPASSTITFNGVTYTNTLTESSTITVTNCPCTVSAPVYTTSSVAVPTVTPVYPTSNGTTTAVAVVPTTAPAGVVGTTSAVVTSAVATATPSSISSSGANKVFTVSGASLAGLLGLAAYLL